MSPNLQQQAGDEPPVRLADLYDYFHTGSKPRQAWRVGVELEKKVVRRSSGQPVRFDEPDGIETILRRLSERFPWEPHYENQHLTTLTCQGMTISLEPGGQLEFATSPVVHLGEAELQLNQHLEELQQVVDPVQIQFLSVGVSPKANIDEVGLNPRPRHRLMAEVMPSLSQYGLHMMKCTCSTQICLDYGNAEDAMRKFRLALLLSPVIHAGFNNAPWYGNRPTGYHSYRSQIWQHMDPRRSGWVIPLLQKGFTIECWVNYALDVPLLFIADGLELKKAPDLTFRQFLEQGLPENSHRSSRYPTLSDWKLHLSTIFTEVRMKQFLEIRGADAVPRPYSLAVPAFWKGILYDEASLDAAEALVAHWPVEQLAEFADVVSHQGFDTPWQGKPLRFWWERCYELAIAGLHRQALAWGHPDEAGYLLPLRDEAYHNWRRTIESWSIRHDVRWEEMRELWAS
ncbi:MAG TPA: glutamate-cysteine ligase family protein [Gemmatales bacterium]|nr:glutamate-cysteine ligase family protein [Gemmatales bacterium]